jgi:hypothetical protein
MIRARALDEQVLQELPWRDGFGIWGAGRNGRQFFNALPERSRDKVSFSIMTIKW